MTARHFGWLGCVAAVLLAAKSSAQQLPDNWGERDLEGKWHAYTSDMQAHASDKNRRKRWAELLNARDEFDLLEWIVLFEGWGDAGKVLAARDSDRLFRAAMWNFGAFDSHDKTSAKKVLQNNGDEVLG